MAIDLTDDLGKVRLLLNDVDAPDNLVFTDEEIQAFLDLEGGSVKLAAAQAIDTNATNQLLATRVFRSQDVTLDGAKLADAMRKHADHLRAQVEADGEGWFEIVDQPDPYCRPELVDPPGL